MHEPAIHSPAQEEAYSSWALLILCTLLVGVLWLSYYFQSRKVRMLHETVVAVLAGILVGLVVRVSGIDTVQRIVTFDYAVFFNLLLPPIIFNSGYDLDPKGFFRNFGTILVFAFAGTLISATVVSALVFLVNRIGLTGIEMGLSDCLSLGAIISATDPVTVLAVFQQMGVEPNLYAVILGESMLNDAVAIVLYNTIGQFRGHELHWMNVLRAVYVFMGIFFGSLAIGLLVGFGCSLLLKHSGIYRYPAIETCIVLLVAYITYLFSNACYMSGIVSLLFCGITLRRYAYRSMSLASRHTTRYMMHVMSQLSENFIFIYLGITVLTQRESVFAPLFILCVMVFVCVARYLAVFPLAKVINLTGRWVTRRQHESIPETYQMMLFWAGLRGAVAFALATSLEGSSAAVIRTTILVVVIMSVVIFGGTTALVVERLGVRSTVAAAQRTQPLPSTLPATAEQEEEENLLSPAARRRVSSCHTSQPHHWWVWLDMHWLQPIFVNRNRAARIERRQRRRQQRAPASISDALFSTDDDYGEADGYESVGTDTDLNLDIMRSSEEIVRTRPERANAYCQGTVTYGHSDDYGEDGEEDAVGTGRVTELGHERQPPRVTRVFGQVTSPETPRRTAIRHAHRHSLPGHRPPGRDLPGTPTPAPNTLAVPPTHYSSSEEEDEPPPYARTART